MSDDIHNTVIACYCGKSVVQIVFPHFSPLSAAAPEIRVVKKSFITQVLKAPSHVYLLEQH